MTRTLRVLMLLAAAFGAGVFVTRQGLLPLPEATREQSPHRAHYQCSMHPQIVADAPGDCPICHMALQRVEDGAAAAVAPRAPSRILFYRHPMRPDVTSAVPAKDETGMDYIPVREDDLAQSAASQVPGHAPFTMPAPRQQLIGVTRQRIERRPLDVEIRAVGKVAYDPMLYQAITDYLEALRARSGVRDSTVDEAREGAGSIVASSALRLRQLGISGEQLKQIAGSGAAPINLLLPGKSVWVYAQVYEYEMDLVQPGQNVEVTTAALPGRKFAAKIVAADPMVDPTTRTLKVRALVQTPDASLRPETFVTVRIRVSLGEKLAVPQDAVLHTGEHEIVFVVKGDYFEPRDIEVGREAQGYYEVIDGLQPGDEIVTSANFLIDSESRFRAALAAFASAPRTPAPAGR